MRRRGATLEWTVLFALASVSPLPCLSQASSSQPSSTDRKVIVTVTDENGVAVRSARVQLQPPPPALPLRCETDFAGHCEFSVSSSERFELEVEKTGYYAISQSN